MARASIPTVFGYEQLTGRQHIIHNNLTVAIPALQGANQMYILWREGEER